MKLAICYFGYPRFYRKGFESTKKLYYNCSIDYYGHFWGNYEIENEVSNFFKPEKFIFEKQVKEFKNLNCELNLSRITKSVFDTISPLYSMQKLHNIIKDCNKEYDFWILTRTDIGVDGDFSLKNINYDKDKIYSTYNFGDEWLNKYIDAKFTMCNKESILHLTNIYDDLEEYVCDKKIPLCHHHLFFHSLLKSNKKMEMIIANPGDRCTGGWKIIRS